MYGNRWRKKCCLRQCEYNNESNAWSYPVVRVHHHTKLPELGHATTGDKRDDFPGEHPSSPVGYMNLGYRGRRAFRTVNQELSQTESMLPNHIPVDRIDVDSGLVKRSLFKYQSLQRVGSKGVFDE